MVEKLPSSVSGRHRPPLVLASGSPRRSELLREAQYLHRVVHPPWEEPAALSRSCTPAQMAVALSYFKARSVQTFVRDEWIIAGDTIAALGPTIIGKPKDRMDARRILVALTGTTHDVVTGVSVLSPARRRWISHDVTRVTMRPIPLVKIDIYLDTGAWRGKAGAYGIQDGHAVGTAVAGTAPEGEQNGFDGDRIDSFVERIDGSYSNVVGFPMELIQRLLRDAGYG